MLEMLVYPVSAVMKFWHWLLADVFGVQANAAWVASVFLLVISVRALVLPFSWQSVKLARINYLMRAHLAEVDKRYGQSADLEDLRAEDEARKQIHKDHNYNPLAGCVPALVQIPVLLGLYRLLQWMAVPDASAGRRIGVLSDAEIASFREATFFNVPLPAYVAMREEQFSFLGTTPEAVRSVALPLILMAVVFTCGNLLITQMRNRTMLDWTTPATRRAYYIIYGLVPLVAALLLFSGLKAPVPVALLMYWVGNNFFTTAQTLGLWRRAVRTMPAEELHRRAQAEALETHRTQRTEAAQKKHALRRLRLSTLTNPSQAGAIHRDIRAQKRAAKQETRDEKAAAKALKKQRAEGQRELMKRRAEERAAEKAAAKKAKDGR